MIKIVNVIAVEPIGAFRLRVRFSDGATGSHDFAAMIAEGGPMVEPLRDADLFKRVYISMGVLTWPNGFDLDAIQLHQEMKTAGELCATAAELVRKHIRQGQSSAHIKASVEEQEADELLG